ncbi:hypothetical protein SAMN05443550_108156 [Pedobacter hartonius]|uniref:Uncharacterized protein n=1 Tax=Pedobacter hartonius TaxID=425514 RepID=A0A1H4FUX8_9SPHI|nr:hypothetical protein SAMN05443550_108156 [Pedobacter hartonius]
MQVNRVLRNYYDRVTSDLYISILNSPEKKSQLYLYLVAICGNRSLPDNASNAM